MKRLLRIFLATIASIMLIFALIVVLLRDLPAGAYIRSDQSGAGAEMWAEIGGFAPVLRLRSPKGGDGPRFLLIPMIGKGVPLQRGIPLMDYDALDDGGIEISFMAEHGARHVLQRMDNAAAAEIRRRWEADREELLADLASIAPAPLTPSWKTSFFNGAFTFNLTSDYVFQFQPSNTAYPGLLVTPRGQRVSREVYLEFVGSTSDHARQVADSETAQFRLDPDVVEIGPDVMAARSPEGVYRLFATFQAGDLSVIARGRTADREQAQEFIAILDAVAPGRAPLTLLSGEYIPAETFPPETAENQMRRIDMALQDLLHPTMLLSQYMAGQDQFIQAPDTAGGPGTGITIRAGLAPKGGLPPAPAYPVKAEAKDRALRVSIDEDSARCLVELFLPVGSHSDSEDLVIAMDSHSASLPDCQDAARIFATLDLEALRRLPAMTQAASLAPHAWRYADVSLPEDGEIRVSGDGRASLLNLDGSVRFTLDADAIWPFKEGWRYKADGRFGLVDAEGREILPPAYEDISVLDAYGPVDETGLLLVRQDGKHGLFDLTRESFTIQPSFDRIESFAERDFVRAYEGDLFRLINKTGEDAFSRTFTEFIIGEPMRSRVRDEDFIALKTVEGSWIFATRVPQPLLQGEFTDLRLERLPVARLFHLTRADGETFTIDSDLNLVEPPAE
ncbi:MAG: WG repeat-containing protein [Pikeienuella sp.]